MVHIPIQSVKQKYAFLRGHLPPMNFYSLISSFWPLNSMTWTPLRGSKFPQQVDSGDKQVWLPDISPTFTHLCLHTKVCNIVYTHTLIQGFLLHASLTRDCRQVFRMGQGSEKEERSFAGGSIQSQGVSLIPDSFQSSIVGFTQVEIAHVAKTARKQISAAAWSVSVSTCNRWSYSYK